ncbi:MAG: ABC transporter permease [Acidobacteriota bacterium]|jgi:predicted permease|nr:ABC transporter permease [Acidobacteriota bacterium]
MNVNALFFAGALTFITGIVVGLFPAVYGARPDLTSLMKEQAGQITGSKSAIRFRMALTVAQIAISLTLIVVSGLFSKSLYNSNSLDIGMKIDQIVTFGVSPSRNGYTPPQSAQFFESLENELAALPGVESITSSLIRLNSGAYTGCDIIMEGYPADSPLANNVAFNQGGADYFKTLGTPIIAGRDFAREDASGLLKVAVINEAFAEKFNLGRDVVGKRIGIRGYASDIEIIGLAQNAMYFQVSTATPTVIVPFQHSDTIESRTFYVKTALPPEMLLPQIRPVMARLDAALPVENLSTMARYVYDEAFPRRLIATLSGTFASLATLLTAVGLYGIFAYDVAKRRREIGLQMALGATRGRLCLMFLRKAALVTLSGGAIGFALSIYAGRLIQSMLYKFEGFDAGVFIGAAALLFLVMLLVVLIPVRRAVMSEPLELLHDE